MGYACVALGLEGSGSASDIRSFLLLFGALFSVYLTASILIRAGRADRSRAISKQVLMWAILFRVALLPAGLPLASWTADLSTDIRSQGVVYRSFLLYDNDVWRYLWDGHVFDAGLDPYVSSPAELEALADNEDPVAQALFEKEIWQDVFDRVTYETYRTVYPPAAQWLFRLLHASAPGSVLAWKLSLVMLDMGTCWLLAAILSSRGKRPEATILYAWNPLVLKELAGSGHLDAMMIFFLVLSIYWMERGRQRASLVAYALAILSKVTPVLLVGLYLRRANPRHWWALGVTLAVGFLPFWNSLLIQLQSIVAFSREWVFNPGLWALNYWFAERWLGIDGRTTASAMALMTTLSLVVWTWRRDDGSNGRFVSGSFLVLAGFLLTSAAVMPWYLLWVLPFAVLRTETIFPEARHPEVLAWVALTGLSLLSYQIYIDQVEHRWWLWVEHGGFFALLGVGWLHLRRRRVDLNKTLRRRDREPPAP